ATTGLLRQRAPGCDGSRPPGLVRRVLRNHRRPGVRVCRRGGFVDADRARLSSRAVRRGPDPAMIRVTLPHHLRRLAQVAEEVQVDVAAPVTQRSVLDALEARYPVLRGTIRDHGTLKRRPFMRFFACEQDLSQDPPDVPLPDAVASGDEPLMVVGAI